MLKIVDIAAVLARGVSCGGHGSINNGEKAKREEMGGPAW